MHAICKASLKGFKSTNEMCIKILRFSFKILGFTRRDFCIEIGMYRSISLRNLQVPSSNPMMVASNEGKLLQALGNKPKKSWWVRGSQSILCVQSQRNLKYFPNWGLEYERNQVQKLWRELELEYHTYPVLPFSPSLILF